MTTHEIARFAGLAVCSAVFVGGVLSIIINLIIKRSNNGTQE